MVKNIIISLCLICGITNTYAQFSNTQYQKIDSLFLDWNKPNSPGGSVGVIKNGEVVFSKAYGLASLEYKVPNSTSTLFNIASISKQFTAMGIVILALEGKLSVDDDIRKHLPDLPDFGEKITIRHMLHHTSGLRSCHALLDLAGWRPSDLRTNEDLYRFMKKQRDLNFKPGDEFGYSNTNYMLMVNIIEKITNEEFPKWMKEKVFRPLGLTNTFVDGDYISVVPNKATSYVVTRSNEVLRYIESWGYNGAGNVHSTSVDMLRWLENFSKPQVGWKPHFKMLQTLDKLNNGKKNNYAFGVQINDFNGVKSIEHSGATPGFIANSVTYPKENLSFIILSNFSRSSIPQKSQAISEILLGRKENTDKKKPASTIKVIDLPVNALVKYEGFYWNDKENLKRRIFIENDTLRYSVAPNKNYPLVPIGNHEFERLGGSEKTKMKFELKGEASIMAITWSNGDVYTSHRYEPVESSDKELKRYTGTYYSPELESTYTITLKDNKLTGYHPRHGYFPLNRVKKDVLQSRRSLGTVKFKKDRKGKIIGILASNGRVINLWFKKL